MVTTISSSAIRSSISMSPTSSRISVLRSSPYFFWISFISSLIIWSTIASLSRIALNLAMFLIKSWYSALIFSLSNPVSLCNLMSRIAWAWMSERSKSDIRRAFASLGSEEDLINSITSSKKSSAFFSPSRICARSSALLRS